jgi:hypothetical protein
MKKLISLWILFLTAAAAAVSALSFASDQLKPEVVNPKLMGIGGRHAALLSGYDTIFNNPAGIAFTGDRRLIGALGIQFSGPLMDGFSLVVDSISGTSESADTTNKLLSILNKNGGFDLGANLTGPIAFGFIKNNMGFGIFNRTFIDGSIPSISKAEFFAGEELLVLWGYSFPIINTDYHKLSVGGNLKGFFRIQGALDLPPTDLLNLVFAGNSALAFDVPLFTIFGLGLDAGVYYSFHDFISAGIVVHDGFSPVFSSRTGSYTIGGSDSGLKGGNATAPEFELLPIDLSAGVSFSIPVSFSKDVISSWKIMVDYRNVLDFINPVYRHPILNLTAGMEFELLKAISLRVGIYDMYLSAGVGLAIGNFKIDAALYSKELGLEPGTASLMNLAISLAFNY